MKPDELTTQNIEYSRTVVPSSMRSPYWKYFGFPSDNANNILTKQKIICTLCNTAIAYNKNTSNLRTHLIAKHIELLQEIRQQQSQYVVSTQQQQAQSSTQQSRKRTHSDMKASAAGVVSRQLDEATIGELTTTELYTPQLTETTETHVMLVETDEPDEEQDVLEIVGPSVSEHLEEYADYSTEPQSADEMDEVEMEAPKMTLMDVTATDMVERVEDESDVVDEELGEQGRYGFVTNMLPKSTTKPTASEFNEQLLDMLITDVLPLSTVQGSGFTRLWQQFANVDKQALCHKLGVLHDTMCQRLSAQLQHIAQTQPYSLCIESGINIDQLTVLCIYVNFYSAAEQELQSVLYQCIVLEPEEFVDIQSVLHGFNLAKCAAVVTNQTNAAVEAFCASNDIPLVNCLESILRRCLSLVFQLPSVSVVFKKVLKTAQDFVKTDTRLLLSLPEVYPQCAWSKLNLLQFVQENITSNGFADTGELEKARELLDYINPLKMTLDTIADEPLMLCSLMRPFTLKLLEEHFSEFFVEGEYLCEVRNILNTELTNSLLKNAFLNEATFFDVRFRCDFLEPSQLSTIKQTICARFKPLLDLNTEQQQRTAIKQEICGISSSSSSSSTRKSSLKSFFQRNTEPTPKAVAQKSSIELEFNKYNCEPPLDLEQCPISWWHDNSYNYKQLKQIADYYLIVPCCVNRLFRCDNRERNELQNKRLMLRNQQAQQIWYLHYNKTYSDKINQQQQQPHQQQQC